MGDVSIFRHRLFERLGRAQILIQLYQDKIDEEKKNSKDNKHMVRFLEMMGEYNNTTNKLPKSADYYVGCFTDSDNELSHWRGYSRTVPSYAIAFRRDAFVKETRTIVESRNLGGVQTRKVTYLGRKEGGPLVDPFIHDRMESMNRLIERYAKAERDDAPLFNIEYEATHIADSLPLNFFQQHRDHFFKHDAFVDEREFRIAIVVHKLPPTEYKRPAEDGDVRFDVAQGAAFMKPYIELKYGKEVMRSLIHKVIVGPTPEPKLACDALERLRQALGYEFPVEYCKLPYRPGW